MGVLKNLAKEFAERFLKEGAEQGAKQGAKEAAEQGAKEAAEQGAKEAAEQGAKEAAEQGTKKAAEEGAEGAAKKSAKENLVTKAGEARQRIGGIKDEVFDKIKSAEPQKKVWNALTHDKNGFSALKTAKNAATLAVGGAVVGSGLASEALAATTDAAKAGAGAIHDVREAAGSVPKEGGESGKEQQGGIWEMMTGALGGVGSYLTDAMGKAAQGDFSGLLLPGAALLLGSQLIGGRGGLGSLVGIVAAVGFGLAAYNASKGAQTGAGVVPQSALEDATKATSEVVAEESGQASPEASQPAQGQEASQASQGQEASQPAQGEPTTFTARAVMNASGGPLDYNDYDPEAPNYVGDIPKGEARLAHEMARVEAAKPYLDAMMNGGSIDLDSVAGELSDSGKLVPAQERRVVNAPVADRSAASEETLEA